MDRIKEEEEQKKRAQAWYEFLLETIEFDKKYKKPNGYHWFMGLYQLHNTLNIFPNFDIVKVQESLPDEHWLKEINLPKTVGAYTITYRLLEKFNTDYEIDGIGFSGIEVFHQDFGKTIDFSGFIFPVEISFESLLFSYTLNFSNTIFLERANFYRTNFNSRSNLNFTNAKFYNDANFNEAKFFGPTNFRDVDFHNSADFMGAEFSLQVIFINTKFSTGANFIKTQFSYPVEFNNTIFSASVMFDSAKFLKGITFTGAVFSGIAGFSNATFNDIASFKQATFSGLTLFKSAILEKATINFDDVKIKKFAPRFHNATVSEDITWDGTTWPEINNATSRGILRHNKGAYENLATYMKKLDKYHDQHFFFRQEMRCRRRLGSVFNRVIYGLYEIFADYGYGVGNAFSWWLANICLWTGVLYSIAYLNYFETFFDDFSCALGVSIANAHGFFFMGNRLSECYKVFEELPFFTGIWVTQIVLGIPLLFILGLTLRVRFRLR